MESPKIESFEQNYHIGETALLKIKKAELIKIKEELKKAKDNATQSWLDSRPLIDELERLKAGLARVEKRHKTSNTPISDLQSELEKINTSIKSKKEGEVNATKTVNEINKALDQLRAELEGLKRYADQKRQSKLKLRRTLRLRRQRLRSFQLALAAARKEAEAYGASAAEAARYTNLFNSEIISMENGLSTDTVQLSHEEYRALKSRAEEKDSIAAWRVSVVEGERVAAESSRDLALAKLKEVKAGKLRLRNRENREINVNNNINIGIRAEEEEDHEKVTVRSEEQYDNINIPPKAAEVDQRPVRLRRSKTRNKEKKMVSKKKSSIFRQIKLCFLGNIIRRLFG